MGFHDAPSSSSQRRNGGGGTGSGETPPAGTGGGAPGGAYTAMPSVSRLVSLTAASSVASPMYRDLPASARRPKGSKGGASSEAGTGMRRIRPFSCTRSEEHTSELQSPYVIS